MCATFISLGIQQVQHISSFNFIDFCKNIHRVVLQKQTYWIIPLDDLEKGCFGGCTCAVLLTHHAIGVGITGLWDGQALNDFWSHPGKSAHHRHVGGVGQELRRPEVTNLKIQTKRERGSSEENTNWPVCLNWMEKCRYMFFFPYIKRRRLLTFSTLSAVITTVTRESRETSQSCGTGNSNVR